MATAPIKKPRVAHSTRFSLSGNFKSDPGRFGPWGGRYVPETLMAALQELECGDEKGKGEPGVKARRSELLKGYAGRATRLGLARRRTEKLGGAKIYLKRE